MLSTRQNTGEVDYEITYNSEIIKYSANAIDLNSVSGYDDRKTEDLIDDSLKCDAFDTAPLFDQEQAADLSDTVSNELRLLKKQSSKCVCESCGKQVPEVSLYCMYCGKPLIK